MDHTYRGDCPDATQPNSRDPECPACKAEDALRRDAERYRWLRVRWGALEEIYEGGTDQMLDIRDAEPGEGWRTDPATLDAAIDAAMNGANNQGNRTNPRSG